MLLGALTGAVAGATLVTAPLTGTAYAAETVVHVATTGADTNIGSAEKPYRSIQKAVDVAQPGATILVHGGTYAGKVKFKKSGTAASPITLTTAGDGAVTVTHNPTPVACDAHQPAADRTLAFAAGVDHWTVKGLSISGGVYISGKGTNDAFRYMNNFVSTKNWEARRAVPGRGSYDPAAAGNALSYIAQKTGKVIDPSDGINLIDNKITRRGVQVSTARYGTIAGNEITDIECGTGPALWLQTLSDGWTVKDNVVRRVAVSTYKHYMQEGIRLGMASSYNTVESNVVEDLPGDGRAFSTDVDGSWNTFRDNTARNVAMGFNEQKGGWGNAWEFNTAERARTYGFAFRVGDGYLKTPSMDTSTYKARVTCNVASGSGKDLWVGAAMNSVFTGNAFSTVGMSKNAKTYWSAQGNTWDGSSSVPASSPSVNRSSCSL
jgi:hypothetical protein